jgi:large subunit ribosomal protein L29
MKMEELKDKTMPELEAKGRELRQELFNLRLQKATSQLENPARMRNLRRDIARVETRISTLRVPAAKS